MDILGKAYPKVRRDIIICHSWMLSSHNTDFVAKESNIAKFAQLFTLVGESQGAGEHLRWIFDIHADEKYLQKNKAALGYYYDLSKVVPKSSLQRLAKQYIMQGGELSDGKGVILTKDVMTK